VKRVYEVTNIVYLYPEASFGTVEKLGAFASVVKYTKDEIEYEDLFDNEDFAIVDEIVFEHIIEED
jgi:hypothetical protein